MYVYYTKTVLYKWTDVLLILLICLVCLVLEISEFYISEVWNISIFLAYACISAYDAHPLLIELLIG